jgi:hypothetical protein
MTDLTTADLTERGDFAPGDRILWAARNGTVRHGRIIRWETLPEWAHTARRMSGKTGHWLVEIDHDPSFWQKDNGFKTWFDAADLIKEIPAASVEEPAAAERPETETPAATVALIWDAYDHTNQLVTRAAPLPALNQPSLDVELVTRFAEIPGVRNPRIDATRTVDLGDVPTPRHGWTEGERHDVPMFPAPRAALAVQCPKCRKRGGSPCESTGGGNRQYVPTHKARIDRVAGWTNAVQEHAEMLVKAVGHYGYGNAGLFAVFEQTAKPIPVKGNKRPTPKSVQLSEHQAQRIEYAAEDGDLYCPTSHHDGDHAIRQTINALEEKGIVFEFERTNSGERMMRLTPFGWQVYRQHRLIIRRLDDAEVDRREQEATR